MVVALSPESGAFVWLVGRQYAVCMHAAVSCSQNDAMVPSREVRWRTCVLNLTAMDADAERRRANIGWRREEPGGLPARGQVPTAC